MTTLDITTARAEALFASPLPAGPHEPAELNAAIAAAVRCRGGVRGCAAVMAHEYGEHPAQAAARMRWARAAVRVLGRRRTRRAALPHECPIHGRAPLESCGLCEKAARRG